MEKPEEQKIPQEIEFSEEKIKSEKDNLAQQLEVVDGNFEFYDNKEGRETFRKEVEMMCRHAFAYRADAMLFMDASARGYGLLANKILPIIRLEYAMRAGIDPSQIKLPTVHFFRPIKGGLPDVFATHGGVHRDSILEISSLDFSKLETEGWQFSSSEDEKKYKALLERQTDFNQKYLRVLYDKLLRHLEGGKILICDESTTNMPFFGMVNKIRGEKPSNQYNFFERWDEEVKKRTKSFFKAPTVLTVKEVLSKEFPNIKFDFHVGGSVLASGYDSRWQDEAGIKAPYAEHVRKNEEAIFDQIRLAKKQRGKTSRTIAAIERSPFVERNEANHDRKYKRGKVDRDKLADAMIQLRKEHTLIAKESFEEIFGKAG